MALTAIDFDKIIPDKMLLATATSRTTGELIFMCDQIKNGNIENTGEKSFVTGTGGTPLSALNRNKNVKVAWENAYVIASGIAAQTGSDIVVASAGSKLTVPNTEIITVTSATSVVLAQIPVGVSGSEVKYIYKSNPDGTAGEKYGVAATASATAFKVDAATKTITLPTGKFNVGDRVIVTYNYETAIGKKISNKGNTFAKDCKLVIDVLCRHICDTNIQLVTKFVFPYLSIDNNFTISVQDEPQAHNFGGDAMQDPCSPDKTFWDWYIVE